MEKIKILLGASILLLSGQVCSAPIYFDFTDKKYEDSNGKYSYVFEEGGAKLQVNAGIYFTGDTATLRWTPNGLGIGGPFPSYYNYCEQDQNPLAVDNVCVQEALLVDYIFPIYSGYVLNTATVASAGGGADFGGGFSDESGINESFSSPGEHELYHPHEAYEYLYREAYTRSGFLIAGSFVLQGISIDHFENIEASLVPAPPAIWLFITGLIGLGVARHKVRK